MTAPDRPESIEGRTPTVHGVVLAGAYRWGASQFERLGPKPSLPVGLTPLVCHVVRWMAEGGVARATVCANGASAREVRRCTAATTPIGFDLDHSEDWTPRGPAGCLKDAGRESDADLLLVAEGTILTDVDLKALIALHVRRQAAATVVVSADPWGAAASGASPRGLGECRLSPSGIYIFDRRVLAHIPDVGYQDLKETLISRLHDQGELVVTFFSSGTCPRVTCLQSYIDVNAWILTRLQERPPASFHRREGALVHEKAHVDPTAMLVGPVLVGRDACIGEGCVVVGPTVVGEDALIEASSVVTRSVLRAQSTVRHGANVDQCAVGVGAVVEPGARLLCEVVLGPERRLRAPAAVTAGAIDLSHASEHAPLPPAHGARAHAPRRSLEVPR